MDSKYWIMDGRANTSIDDAIVLETCDTLEEAKESLLYHSFDAVIVNVKTKEIVWTEEDE